VFGIVVVVVFQSVFCLEMYQNIFFNFFDISASKRSKNIKKIHLKQKKKSFLKDNYAAIPNRLIWLHRVSKKGTLYFVQV
jgi:hypothetical protein